MAMWPLVAGNPHTPVNLPARNQGNQLKTYKFGGEFLLNCTLSLVCPGDRNASFAILFLGETIDFQLRFSLGQRILYSENVDLSCLNYVLHRRRFQSSRQKDVS